MYKSLLGDVLALKRAVVVLTFRTVYSARLQENAGLLMFKSHAKQMAPLPTQYTASRHTQTGIYTALHSIIHALSLLSTTHWSAVLSAPVTNTALKLQLNGYKHFNFNQPKPSLSLEERPQFKSTITLPYIGHT